MLQWGVEYPLINGVLAVVDLQQLRADGCHGDSAEHTAGVCQGVANHRVGGKLWMGALQHVYDGRHTGGGGQRCGERTRGRRGLYPQQRHQQPRQPHQTDEKHNDEEDHSPAAFAEVGEEGMPGRQPDGVDEDRQAELEE